MRALKDRRSMRETIIAALVEFGRGEDIGREQSYRTKRTEGASK